jgi:hypothetical protein
MPPPTSPHHTCPKNATQCPGLVPLKGQKKRYTKAQIAQDKEHTLEAQTIKEVALQHGINRITGIEATMEIEQATQGTTRVKPIKPQARPVKKKESMQGTTSELTSETHPVQARVQDTGGYCTADVTDSDRVHQQRQSSAPIKVVLDQDRLG